MFKKFAIYKYCPILKDEELMGGTRLFSLQCGYSFKANIMQEYLNQRGKNEVLAELPYRHIAQLCARYSLEHTSLKAIFYYRIDNEYYYKVLQFVKGDTYIISSGKACSSRTHDELIKLNRSNEIRGYSEKEALEIIRANTDYSNYTIEPDYCSTEHYSVYGDYFECPNM